MRVIAYKLESIDAFAELLESAEQELPLPSGQLTTDGEWVLAMFEVGTGGRATAAAARGIDRGASNYVLEFERRDWDRLVQFATAASERKVETLLSTTVRDESRARPASIRPSMHPGVLRPSTIPPPAREWMNEQLMKLAAECPANVLLVDDDEGVREVVTTMLESVGLGVLAVASAEEALAELRLHAYDLILLDWSLPGMSGVELCKTIRADAVLASLPVLFLSGHASSRDVVQAFASGADDYVSKPFRAPELGARVFGLLRRVRSSDARDE